MLKKISTKMGAWLLLFVLVFAAFFQDSIASKAVTPSSTEYYMTYTVKSAAQIPVQFGLIGTEDYTRNFPYDQGGLMRYIGEEDATLLDAGSLCHGWSAMPIYYYKTLCEDEK